MGQASNFFQINPNSYIFFFLSFFQSSWEDMALEVTMSSVKEYRRNLQDTFKLIGCTITMTN